MKMRVCFSAFLVTAALLCGCKTVRVEGPEVAVPAVKPQIKKAARSLTPSKRSAADLPAVLGGVVQSDSWVIYKDKEQEEFSGHVSYDNGVYAFRSDYALSERALSRFSASGNVYLRQNDRDGKIYQAYADRAQYNYKTQKGTLTANATRRVKLLYTDEKKQTVTAYAKRASFDAAQKVFILQGNVRVERPTPEGKEILTAQKATFKQNENYALLEGDAKLTDGRRTLNAQTIVYDGNANLSYACGNRPLAYGTNEENTFAIIADKIQSDNQGKQITLDGKVQGWVVSPRLNESEVNAKF